MLDTSLNDTVAAFLDDFGKALEKSDIDRATGMFLDDCYWRDLVTFSWNIKTVEGKDEVADMLRHQLATIRPANWRIADGEVATEEDGVTTAWITFETEVARGYGLIRLRDGKIWTLLTSMVELKGHEEPLGYDRPMGAKHGAAKHRPSWKEEREAEARELGYTKQPYVLIVGGGQGGIALGARLRQLGVPTIIVEKNDRPGDSWRNRYKSLCLHDPVWYDHLPYLPFPPNWPVFSPKDKIGDWLEMYTRIMELNYWTRTTCKSAKYDEATKEWTVVVDRDGEEVVLKPKQLVLATGMSGKAEPAQVSRNGDVQGRPAPFLEAPRSGRLQGQEGGGHRVEQFGPRYLRRALGERRRRDHGAAQLDPHRAVRHADGYRTRRALFRRSGAQRDDHQQGRHDLCLAALPDPARVPDPALRPDEGNGQGLLRRAGKGGLQAGLGRRRVGPVHEIPAPRLGLLHRRRRQPADHRRQDQACAWPGHGNRRGRRDPGGRHQASRRT